MDLWSTFNSNPAGQKGWEIMTRVWTLSCFPLQQRGYLQLVIWAIAKARMYDSNLDFCYIFPTSCFCRSRRVKGRLSLYTHLSDPHTKWSCKETRQEKWWIQVSSPASHLFFCWVSVVWGFFWQLFFVIHSWWFICMIHETHSNACFRIFNPKKIKESTQPWQR